MNKTNIKDILKNFQAGVDFTIESGEKIIFHNEELINYLIHQLEAKEFVKVIKEIIPSSLCSYEENGQSRAFVFKSGNNKKNRKQEIEKSLEENTDINITYHGENSCSDRILYQQGKNDLPDQLTLISGEIVKKQEMIDDKSNFEAEFQEFEDELKKSEVEWRRAEEEWKKRETELRITGGSIKHSWRSWNNDGTIGEERMYIESENQSQLITLENKKDNFPQIQGMNDKETTDKNSLTTDKKEKELETNQQDFSQKTDNKEPTEKESNLVANQQNSSLPNNKKNNQNIYYGVGLISLVLLVISVMVVWVKKKG